MRIFTRNWQLKAMAFLLSLLLWLVFHYSGGRPARQARNARPRAAAAAPVLPAAPAAALP